MKKAVFCGTFDPMTLGHLSILKKAGRVFDKVYVALNADSDKSGSSTLQERLKIAKQSIEGCDFAEVISFSGMLTDFCKAINVYTLVRGIRNASDYIYENDLLKNYQTQCDLIECVYFMTDQSLSHISSSVVREVAMLGGRLESYVPKAALSLVDAVYKKPSRCT